MRLIGVDVGGTFTDLVLCDTAAGRTEIHKVPTTRPIRSRGVIQGVRELCWRRPGARRLIDHLFHGTTIADQCRARALLLEERHDHDQGLSRHPAYRPATQRPEHYSIMPVDPPGRTGRWSSAATWSTAWRTPRSAWWPGAGAVDQRCAACCRAHLEGSRGRGDRGVLPVLLSRSERTSELAAKAIMRAGISRRASSHHLACPWCRRSSASSSVSPPRR